MPTTSASSLANKYASAIASSTPVCAWTNTGSGVPVPSPPTVTSPTIGRAGCQRPLALLVGRAEGAESRLGETLRVAGWERFAEDHAAQVEGTSDDVLGEFEIAVGPDLTTINGAPEHLRAGLSSWIDETLGEYRREVRRAARLGDQRLDHAANEWVRQHGDRVLGNGHDVAAQRARVGREDGLGGELADQIDEHLFLGGPPAIQRRLAHPRALGHPVHGQACVPALAEFGEERGDDRLGLLRPQNGGAGWLAGSHGASV